MTYGGNAYGSAPYGSSAPSTGGTSTVSLAPAVVDLVAPTLGVKVAVRVDLQPAVVDLVAPTVTPAVYDDEYEAAVLALSPTVYWRLGESSGTTANDSSGNGYDGIIYGAPTLGATGLLAVGSDTAIEFDGFNDWAVNTSFSFSGDHTLTAWFDSTDTDGTIAQSVLEIWIDSTGHVVAGTALPRQGQVTSTATYNDGAAHMVAATYTSSTKTVELWVDGQSQGTAVATNAPNDTTRLRAASGQSLSSDYLAAVVDEIAAWNGTNLSDSAIANLYSVGSAAGPVTISLEPAVVDLVAPVVSVDLAETIIPLSPAVLDLVAPAIGSPANPISVDLEPAVLELVAPRIPRRLLVTPWTLDDWGSTAFGVEIQQEPVLRWGDPVAESGWRPIRTNRITWASLAVDPSTGRPRTPTTVTVALKPAVLEVAAPALQL